MVGKRTRDDQASCSILSILAGLSAYDSPNDILRSAVDSIAKPNGEHRKPEILGSPMHWGNIHEPKIIELGLKKLLITDYDDNCEPVHHSTLPLSGSPDALCKVKKLRVPHMPEEGVFVMGDDDEIVLDGLVVVEAKAIGKPPQTIPDLNKGPYQVEGLMMCTGAKYAVIAHLYQGIHLRVFVTKSNPEIRKHIEELIPEFQKKINDYKVNEVVDWYPVANPLDGVSTYKVDQGLPPVVLGGEDMAIVDKLLEAQQLIKSGQKIKDECTSYLMSIMANHDTAVGNNVEIHWPQNSARKSYTVAARPPTRGKSLRVKVFDDV